ncbi:MAG: hypothetical protein EOP49_40320 [Sphingobacteriales bacterium]|nr:MAG: hypothetical protein EOP49_40320 [Sphingobacteriales bacterium]
MTANGLTLTGTDAGNYELASNTATDTADIAKATLTATLTAQDKVYDGSTTATGSFGDDRISGDDLSVTGTANFADKNAGVGKTVTANGLTLTGTDAANYILSSSTATDTADIAKAKATVTANSKTTTYDGTIQSVNGFSATGLVSGENTNVLTQVTVTGATGKDAGNYENTVSGTDKNYDLTFNQGSLDILPTAIIPPQPNPVYPTWSNPYQRAIRFMPVQQEQTPQQLNPVEIEIMGTGINMDNIQTLLGEK